MHNMELSMLVLAHLTCSIPGRFGGRQQVGGAGAGRWLAGGVAWDGVRFAVQGAAPSPPPLHAAVSAAPLPAP
ncbi:unnamed protein product, partial [Closterium sp. NIES-53]